MNNKEITFFISSLAGGGAERVCVNIANGLVGRGWKVTIVVLHLEREVYKSELSEAVNLICLNVTNARYAPYKLYKFLKDNQISKLVVFNYELTVLLLLVRTIGRLRFKLIARNINSLSEKMQHHGGGVRHKVLYMLMKKVYKQSDHIINQCYAMKDDLLSVLPSVGDKSSVIYNPVNTKVIENTDFSLSNSHDYLLCVGRLEKQKAFHFAIESFALISEQHPELRLKIVGKGSLELELRSLCKTLEIENKVDFEGFNSNISSYYYNAKATLLTSLYEGFPNVLIESISLGTPVISFNCKSGPSEIIIEGENGVLVDFQDVKGMAVAVNQLLESNYDKKGVISTSLPFSKGTILEQWEKLIYVY